MRSAACAASPVPLTALFRLVTEAACFLLTPRRALTCGFAACCPPLPLPAVGVTAFAGAVSPAGSTLTWGRSIAACRGMQDPSLQEADAGLLYHVIACQADIVLCASARRGCCLLVTRRGMLASAQRAMAQL